MSGDDTVELGYDARPAMLGRCIGVGIRLAIYSKVGNRDIQRILPILHFVATKYTARLMGLPTMCSGPASDQVAVAKLLKGYPDATNSQLRFETIREIIRKVGKCRMVITGAFHSAVFALSQGVPVVCLTNSKEYSIKFEGLEEQFGDGCQILHLADRDFARKLAHVVDVLWGSAERLRPGLLEAARCQIELGLKGYQRIHEAYQGRQPVTTMVSPNAMP